MVMRVNTLTTGGEMIYFVPLWADMFEVQSETLTGEILSWFLKM